MCCVGGVEGGRGQGGKGKAKLDPPYELAYLGPERTAGGWWATWGLANVGQADRHEAGEQQLQSSL